MESPAPCSTRRERLEISLLSCEMVSFARASFSCDASTIFHAFSISRFSDAMVFWSSCDSFSAVCTLAALETISELSSRHFLMSRFSLSCDFLSARCSFSYSCRKRSRLLSPTSSVSTSWKSRSKVSNAFDSKPRPSSSPSAMVDHWGPCGTGTGFDDGGVNPPSWGIFFEVAGWDPCQTITHHHSIRLLLRKPFCTLNYIPKTAPVL